MPMVVLAAVAGAAVDARSPSEVLSASHWAAGAGTVEVPAVLLDTLRHVPRTWTAVAANASALAFAGAVAEAPTVNVLFLGAA